MMWLQNLKYNYKNTNKRKRKKIGWFDYETKVSNVKNTTRQTKYRMVNYLWYYETLVYNVKIEKNKRTKQKENMMT